jgi:hypothetical protein
MFEVGTDIMYIEEKYEAKRQNEHLGSHVTAATGCIGRF